MSIPAQMTLSSEALALLCTRCYCEPADVETGRVRITSYVEDASANRIHVSVEHPTRGRIGFFGALYPPPGGWGKTKTSTTAIDPPPSMMPAEALHRLPPRVVERIEMSFGLERGAVGSGRILVVAFGTWPCSVAGLFQAQVYVVATNASFSLISSFEPIPRHTVAHLSADELAVALRVFGRLRRWRREAEPEPSP